MILAVVSFFDEQSVKVNVPAHRPIKAVYIKQFVRLVKFGQGDYP